MSQRQILPTNRNDEADRSHDTRTSTYTSNVTTAPTHSLSGRDTVRPDETESLLADKLGVAEASKVATSNYIYYRIFAEDGAVPSKTPAVPGDPFLGRIKARSVPPPHHDTAQAVKRTIAKVENIKDCISTSLFSSPYSQSPMGNSAKVTILNRTTGPGSTPQDPLAFVAKISGSALESEGRPGGGLNLKESATELDATPPEVRYLYYLLYANDYEMPSKVAVDLEEPSLGRIRVDSVTPPHGPATIKLCISRVEKTPAFAHADLFADISCNTPLKEGHISILSTDCPGLSPKKPLAIVLDPSLPDGRYVIKNRAADIYWNAWSNPIKTVHFWPTTKIANLKNPNPVQWDITHDTDGHIFITSPFAPSSWVGKEITGSTIPVPWRLIRVNSKFYYLTTEINPPYSRRNPPRVPAAQPGMDLNAPGSMAGLEEGNQWQMWEFIPSLI